MSFVRPKTRTLVAFAGAACLLVAGSPRTGRAQWPSTGLPICVAPNYQYNPTVISDGAGGAFIAWDDERSANYRDIYVQRVNFSGTQWTPNGVVISQALYHQLFPTMALDGAGGVIITWHDSRADPPNNIDVYAQRMDASGNRRWQFDGVPIATTIGLERIPLIISDGAGGAIIAFEEWPPGATESDVSAQRINAAGIPQWELNGRDVCNAYGSQHLIKMVSDDQGGAILAWSDERNGENDIYAQRINASGDPLWPACGVPICRAGGPQLQPDIMSDGAHGAVIVWHDLRSQLLNSYDIYAQRVNESGVVVWADDGVPICNASGSQHVPRLVTDGANGAIIVWDDDRMNNSGVYAQRLGGDGSVLWVTNGVMLSSGQGSHIAPKLVSDENGGAIVVWESNDTDNLYLIHAQRVNGLGESALLPGGVILGAGSGHQWKPQIAPDAFNGAFVVWEDLRGPSDFEIYAQHISEPENAVAITSFAATTLDHAVVLRGTVRSDLSITTINVYRGISGDSGPMSKLSQFLPRTNDAFEYVDDTVRSGLSYRYQVGVVDGDGEFLSTMVDISVGRLGIELEQNSPNPFNPTTRIVFSIPDPERAKLEIFDARGRRVRTLLDEDREPGRHVISWNGQDDDGVVLQSGIYFCRLTVGKFVDSKKIVLLK